MISVGNAVPALEYWSHIWGTVAQTFLALLDVVQKRVIRLPDMEQTSMTMVCCSRYVTSL